MSPTRKIFRLAMAATALVALGVIWFAYWQTATGRFQIALDEWAVRERAVGRVVEYGQPTFSGFPFAIRASIADPVYAIPTTGWHWHGPALLASASPLDPLNIAIDAPGAHTVDGPKGLAWMIAADSLTGSLDFSLQGLDAVAIEGTGLRAIDDNGLSSEAGFLALSVTPAERSPATYSDLLAGFAVSFDELVLPPANFPFGDRVERFHLEGRVMGPLPPGDSGTAIEAWRSAGGTVEIDALSVQWGPLGAAGDGTFALDTALQPEGAMSMTLTGYEAAIAALVTQGFIEPQQAAIARTVMVALQKTPDDGGPAEVTLPVTLQDRTLSVGPIKFARLDPIDWPVSLIPFGN